MKHLILISALTFCCSAIEALPLKKSPKKVEFNNVNSRFVKMQLVPTMEGEKHFQAGMEAFEKQSYSEAIRHFRIVQTHFGREAYGSDAIYYEAVSHYNANELDLANDSFSEYLKDFMAPKYFQQAIEYKFSIAERLKEGERKRLLGTKIIPKWFNGKTLAVEVYDEVIAALPSHENAARALYSKGMLLREMKEFRESVETFQTLIKRFPRHELTPESYLAITKVYLEQSQYEYQNPDLITFGEINLRKFTQDFPRESRISEMKKDVDQIKEIYAQGLYDTGQYYERVDKWNASIFCYKNAIEKFPDSEVAKKCEERVVTLDSKMRRMAADTRDPRFKTQRVKNFQQRKLA